MLLINYQYFKYWYVFIYLFILGLPRNLNAEPYPENPSPTLTLSPQRPLDAQMLSTKIQEAADVDRKTKISLFWQLETFGTLS